MRIYREIQTTFYLLWPRSDNYYCIYRGEVVDRLSSMDLHPGSIFLQQIIIFKKNYIFSNVLFLIKSFPIKLKARLYVYVPALLVAAFSVVLLGDGDEVLCGNGHGGIGIGNVGRWGIFEGNGNEGIVTGNVGRWGVFGSEGKVGQVKGN